MRGNFDKRALTQSISTTQADAETFRVVLKQSAVQQRDIATADIKQALLRAPLEDTGGVVVVTPKASEDLSVLPTS